jgi:predicted RNase H-like nuclease (RuvC/YqgF family)
MRLLITGIDPGTTTAYAILDIDGKTIAIRSRKELSIDSVVKEITSYGDVIIVGTDKQKCPAFIEKFKAQTGAKLITPKQDLLQEEKREIIRGEKASNAHEEDALAAARFAYREIKPLFDKTDRLLKEKGKENYSEKVKEMIVRKEGMSINMALDILTEPQKPEVQTIMKVLEKKELTEKDFLNIYRMLKITERENHIIKEQNRELKRIIRELESEKRTPLREKTKDHIRREMITKEHNINILSKEVQKRERIIQELKKEAEALNKFISESKNKILIKKLDSLGWNEFKTKNLMLNIGEGDILLVKDVSAISENTLQELKGKIRAIIAEQKAKIKGFITIQRSKLNLKETEHYALADKNEIEKELNSQDIIARIVEEYRER